MRYGLKRVLWSGLALFLVAIIVVIFESTFVVVDHVEVTIEGLPVALDGYRIVHVSDFHGRKLATTGRLVHAITQAKPDVIAATGDYVNHSFDELASVLLFLRVLTTIAPVYAVSGNHDYWDWRSISAELSNNGITVLQNEHRVLDHNGGKLVLAGVNDPFTGHADLAAALPTGSQVPIVLLAHSPTWFEARRYYADGSSFYDAAVVGKALDRVDLTLVGHTHGGQIKLPFIGALSNASGRMFPKDYVEGLSQEGSGWLYISRGIGFTSLPVRFLSRAQVTIVTLRAKGA